MTDKSHGSSPSGQSKGGQPSGGNFKNDPKRAPEAGKASEAGKKGSEHSHGGTHEQPVKAGDQSHKNK